MNSISRFKCRILKPVAITLFLLALPIQNTEAHPFFYYDHYEAGFFDDNYYQDDWFFDYFEYKDSIKEDATLESSPLVEDMTYDWEEPGIFEEVPYGTWIP